MKVEVAALGLPVPNSLCGQKATVNVKLFQSSLRSCVNVEVAVLGPRP